MTQIIELVDRIPATGAHYKFRPDAVLADRAYDSRKHRRELKQRGIKPRIPKRGTPMRPRCTAPASAQSAGSSSAPSPGCITTAGSLAATTAAPTSTKRSSRSAAHSSATATSNATTNHFVRASKDKEDHMT